jgi:hypothetical protein
VSVLNLFSILNLLLLPVLVLYAIWLDAWV